MTDKKHGPWATRYLLQRDGQIHQEAMAVIDVLENSLANLQDLVDEAAIALGAAATNLTDLGADASLYRQKAKALMDQVEGILVDEAKIPDDLVDLREFHQAPTCTCLGDCLCQK